MSAPRYTNRITAIAAVGLRSFSRYWRSFMNKRFKTRWTKALRSGEYEQGRSRLVSHDDKFCCLGVACNLLAEDGFGAWVVDEFSGEWSYETGDHVSDIMLPPEAALKIGLKDDAEDALVQLNDDGGSFDEIADWIEEKL
jgi:hypothetical protein